MPARKVLLALDGNSLAHRAFHGYEKSGLARSDGSPAFAVYGFCTLMAGICDKVRPDAMVVGFDDPRPEASIRRRRWPHYKANRPQKDPSLYSQMADIQAVLAELGVTVVVPQGLEADDVLGSAAAAAHTSGWDCVVATSDRDSFCLVSTHTTVLRLVSGLENAVWMTPDRLLADYGVTGQQYSDYAALRGDTSDNLPGVMGIGEKTAAKLLARMGDVKTALASPAATAELIGKANAAKLVAGREVWELNREMMALHSDVPIELDNCVLGTEEHVSSEVMRRWEMPSLATKMATALAQVGAHGSLPAALGDQGDKNPPVASSYPPTAPEHGTKRPGEPAGAGIWRPWCTKMPDRLPLTMH